MSAPLISAIPARRRRSSRRPPARHWSMSARRRRRPGRGDHRAKDSPIAALPQLKGKRVALNRGSNVHYLLVGRSPPEGSRFGDITAGLSGARRRARRVRSGQRRCLGDLGSVPRRGPRRGPRTRPCGATGLAPNREFQIASSKLATEHPDVIRAILSEVDRIDQWASANQSEAAKDSRPRRWACRCRCLEATLSWRGYGVAPITPDIVADQQNIADTFTKLRLIPAEHRCQRRGLEAASMSLSMSSARRFGAAPIEARRHHAVDPSGPHPPVWQLGCDQGWITKRVLPSPASVLRAGFDLAQSGELQRHVMISCQRALLGFVIGGSLGFVLRRAERLVARSERLLDTSLQMLRNVPHLAMIPLVILWFGIDESGQAVPGRGRRVLPDLPQHLPRHPHGRSRPDRDGAHLRPVARWRCSAA